MLLQGVEVVTSLPPAAASPPGRPWLLLQASQSVVKSFLSSCSAASCWRWSCCLRREAHPLGTDTQETAQPPGAVSLCRAEGGGDGQGSPPAPEPSPPPPTQHVLGSLPVPVKQQVQGKHEGPERSRDRSPGEPANRPARCWQVPKPDHLALHPQGSCSSILWLLC